MSLAALVMATALGVAPGAEAPRGNTVLARDAKKFVYSLAAAARLGVLLGNARNVIQPLGFGFALQFRFHGLRVGPTRFGLELTAGHTRFMERLTVTATDPDGNEQNATRWAALSHTDFALGPSLQIPIRPVIVTLGAGGGVAVSQFVRPQGPYVTDEEEITDVAGMLRAGGQIGVPIRNNQGIVVGAAFQQVFSNAQVIAEPQEAEADAEPDTSVFDILVETYLAYQVWF